MNRAIGGWRGWLMAMGIVAATAGQGRGQPAATQPAKFEASWESLKQYQAPEWFRDAKFGIWAHWGPQCEPEFGDWYARDMYIQGSRQYESHLKTYGHPSVEGFKEIIHRWKAENWDPDKLLALYKKAGAQYFVALANHHDNFDLWDSTYQPWNSVAMGPKKNLIEGWARATRAQGLKFGVSVHAAHAWMWYEPAQGHDKTGPLAGVPYDGVLTAADGKGKWWKGLDPQALYAQAHKPSTTSNTGKLWDWDAKQGCSIPDQAYCDKFYNRTTELIDKYQPDLVYFDDTALPLWPVSHVGLKLAAHFYNDSMARNDGKLEGVLFGKVLTPEQRQCMVWDIERGQSDRIEPLPWQTDTCLGRWHYDRTIYDKHGYKSAATVIRTLADIVSKNGNLLLSVPVRADGTIDDQELDIVEGIASWMDVNREAIFGTRPWKVFGEGPAMEPAAQLKAQGFNEGKGKPFTAEDVRFTAKGNMVYAILLGQPKGQVRIKSLGKKAALLNGDIRDVSVLGSNGPVKWEQRDEAMTIEPPASATLQPAVVVKVSMGE